MKKIASLGLCGALLPCIAAFAADENFDVYVLADVAYDDNVFRLADSAEALAQTGSTTQDDIRTTYGVGGSILIPVSRQEFSADAELRRTVFDRFSQLDNNNGQFNGQWNWTIASRANGVLGYDYDRSLTNFFELQDQLRDTVTNQAAYLNANVPVHPRWTLVAGGESRDLSYSERDFLDHNQVALYGEALFQTRGKTFVGLRLQENYVRFDASEDVATVGAVDNDFDETVTGGVVRWEATGKSRFTGILGHTRRDADSPLSGDFSGTTGRAEYRRIISGKTHIDFAAYRETSVRAEVASLAVQRGLAVIPLWNISPKLSLRGHVAYEEVDFSGAGFTVNGAQRMDEVLTLRAGLDYRLNRALTLQFGIGHQTRDSNQDNAEFDQNDVNAGLRFLL